MRGKQPRVMLGAIFENMTAHSAPIGPFSIVATALVKARSFHGLRMAERKMSIPLCWDSWNNFDIYS
jgi:hypothetical protein